MEQDEENVPDRVTEGAVRAQLEKQGQWREIQPRLPTYSFTSHSTFKTVVSLSLGGRNHRPCLSGGAMGSGPEAI